MTIKKRLIIIAGILVALLILAATAQQIAKNTSHLQAEHSKTRYLSYLIADEFRQSSMDLTRLCRTYVATGDNRYWDAYWHIVKWRNGEVARPANIDADLFPGVHKKQSDIMKALQFSSQEFELLAQASKNSNALIATEEQAMRSIREGTVVAGPFKPAQGETVKAFAKRIVFDQNYHNEVTSIMTPVAQFFTALDQRTATQLSNAEQNASLWLTVALLCQGLVALAIAALLLFIMRSIFRPLGQAVTAMNNISQGERDLTRRLNAHGNHELAALGQGFNGFADDIQNIVVQLRDSIAEITQVSNQLSSNADHTDTAVSRQKQGIEALLTAVDQVLPAIETITGNAQQAKTQADAADHEAKAGQAVVSEAMENIQALADEMHNAGSVISSLAEDSDSIGSVLDVICGIADQTNLLALNAAIEAARAGEQGRGFAVVADEVRSLAQRTQDSTAEIQSMIEKLQTGARDAVTVMEQSRSRADTCVEKTNEASQRLCSIAQAVQSINGVNTGIADASQSQASTINHVRGTITDINAELNNTAEGAQQTALHSARTEQLAREIHKTMQQFVV